MAAGGAKPVFKINDFFEKAEEISKFVSPENQAKYKNGLILLRSAWTKRSVPTLRKKGNELADMLPALTNKNSVHEIKQVLMSLHERIQAYVSKAERNSSQGSSISSSSHGSISSDTPKLTGRDRRIVPSSSTHTSVMSDESFSLNTIGTTATTDARTDKKDTKQTIETIDESRDDTEIEADLEALLKTLENKLLREQINYRKINYSNKETGKQRCRSHISQIEFMFDSVIAAFYGLGVTKEELNNDIRHLKGRLGTEENRLHATFMWIAAANAFVNTGDLAGDKTFQDVARQLPREIQDAPLRLSDTLIDLLADTTKLKRIEEWISAITRYALNSNSDRPSLPGEERFAGQMRVMLDQIDALKFHRKKSQLLEEWIKTVAIGAEDGVSELPKFECSTELQEECSQIKKTLESVSQSHISRKEFEDELEKLEVELQNWSEEFKITGSKCKTQSANRIRQCRNLISSRKADDSIERNSDLDQEIRALANDIEHWEEVENLPEFGKNTRTYLRDLRIVRIFLSWKKQDDLRRNERLQYELDSFEIELQHWKDCTDIKDLNGDSSMISSLRQLRVKLLQRKRKSVEIKEKWKEDRQITQQFVEDILSLLQSSLIRLKSEPYSFHEPKGRKDVKHYSEFFADLQLCVYQLVDCIEFNAKRFATLYIGFSKAVQLLGEHYFALTSEQYQISRKETSYENIIQSITDRLVQQGITK